MSTKEQIGRIEEKIRQRIAEYAMLSPGSCVLCGFSGGADSTALLHFLWQHREEYTISVFAVHVNHLLRGEESERDQHAAEKFCREKEIPLRVFRRDVKAFSLKEKLSLEEGGRKIRYACFREAASSLGESCRIATAHTASDLTETVLLNLVRGAGPKGLQGIPPVRGNIIRPLLSLTREEIEAYCHWYGLSYCTDSSNLLPEFDRNRLRLQVLPELKKLNPALEERVASCAELLRRDTLFLDTMASDAYEHLQKPEGFLCSELRELSEPILSRLLKRLLEEAGGRRLSFFNVEEAREALINGGVIMVSGGVRMDARGEYLMFTVPRKEKTELPAEWSVPLCGPSVKLPDGREFSFLPVEEEEKITLSKNKINNLLFNNRAFYDRILYAGIIRNRRAGDSYRPVGRSGSRPLKKLFNDVKIPVEERWKRALLVDSESGKILWAEGFGPCEELSSPREKATEAFVVQITGK